MAYNLREGPRKDYRRLNSPEKLPRAVRTTTDKNKLYPVEVLESREETVKIHYVGYDDKFDEWRKKEDIVCPSDDKSDDNHHTVTFWWVRLGVRARRRLSRAALPEQS